MSITLTVNAAEIQTDAAPDTPLLWVLRDELGLTGTKFGCGIAACGACTVHVAGQAVRSCQVAVGDLWGTKSRNAAIASPARSCRRRICWPIILRPPMPILTPP